MHIIGFKCFNKNLTNRYGFQYKIGKTYNAKGKIKFGNDGNGFHFCKNLEDTLRYYDALKEQVDICLVVGFGNIVMYEDTYNEYYDMYASENMIILRKLSRDEIIKYAYNLRWPRINRFLSGFLLTAEEIKIFKSKFYNKQDIINTIEYYQEGKLDTYTKKYIKK